MPIIDIESLSFERGAHLLVKHALETISPGEMLVVTGSAPGFEVHIRAWCRGQGHGLDFDASGRACIRRGGSQLGRWNGTERCGSADRGAAEAIADRAKASWGLAARGALVETGGPEFDFSINCKWDVWADEAAELYRQAVAAQWNPDAEVDWQAPFELPQEIEAAVVQVMTYLIENENAALLVAARFLGRLHPHFREVMQLLAIQAADEARHVEVFTRRLCLRGSEPALSTVGGQASLKTLLDEPDFSTAYLLLSVLGEGTFVSLLNFLHEHAPDPVTRQIARLTARDEARHVAFGMAHLQFRLRLDPGLRMRLSHAIEARSDALAGTAGFSEAALDALVILASGAWTPSAVAVGFRKVQHMKSEMAAGRQRRLEKLGFEKSVAQRLADLHTQNFM